MEFQSLEDQLKDHLGLFFDSLKVGDVVLLQADLGMGKTTLVRHFVEDRFEKAKQKAESSGLEDVSASRTPLKAVQFSSPSYNLIQEYKLADYTIYHIDLYRLEDEDQVESVGLWDVLADARSITFIEWAERINIEDLPARTTYEVHILSNATAEDKKSSLDSDGRQYVIKKIR